MIMVSKRIIGFKMDRFLFLLRMWVKISRSSLFMAFVMGSSIRYMRQKIAPENRRVNVLLKGENLRKMIVGVIVNIEVA